MRPISVVTVAVLAVALASTSTTSSSRAQSAAVAKPPAPAVLGISHKQPWGALAWFDPLTLRALPGRKPGLGYHSGSWAFSADRARLAIGNCDQGSVNGIRFVNARAMRTLGDLELQPRFDCVTSLAWLRPNRLLAVLTSSSSSDATIAVVDPASRRVVRRVALPAAPWGVARTSEELVLFFGTSGSFAPARIAVVDPDGNLRDVTVTDVLAGSVWDDTATDPHGRTVLPGFAVDPDGRRAFLIPSSGPLAEIDLQTLRVGYHELDRPSLLHRFLRWLTPVAEGKAMEGPTRLARWLGDGLLALAGTDYSIRRDASGKELEVGTPTGVRLIDTRSWTSRMLSADSNDFALGPGVVIAEGGRWDWDAQKMIGPGVIAFGLDGRERWRLPQNDPWIEAHPALGYGYVGLGDQGGPVTVIDLVTGEVVRTIKADPQGSSWPTLLDGQASEW